ncbi:MAG: hypothetical protein LBF22_09365 [Deltaproteobacteria bacterium]|jgi:hypothetical protein|nr:hypothetical protein [Deltaproteobacteria bacterium]
MPKLFFAVSSLILFFLCGTLKAQTLDALSALDKAEAAHQVGDNITALEAIWIAQEAIWHLSPLGIRNVAFVTEEPEYFGVYKPKIGENFTPNELLILYCEPFGFTQRKEPDGTYTNSLLWSFNVLDSNGQILGGQNNIGPYTHQGYRTFSAEKMLALTINLSQVPPGAYKLQMIITDNLNQSKSVEIQKPFNIVNQP